eukprot:TRINITY_DN5875_c0_g1_i1.p1 TRINITY_DN5875_c0_g1~~TRINITY_DN5875_c0_g1_i1.p1  ORF type:complete len:251 (-),score=24.39 TRINITY_DN5875_c0_g1_i1:591-1343(-)
MKSLAHRTLSCAKIISVAKNKHHMNTHTSLLICLLGVVAIRGQPGGTEINWDMLFVFEKGEDVREFGYHQPPNGDLHIFREKLSGARSELIHHVITSENVVETKKVMEAKEKGGRFLKITAKASTDGRHLAVAYTTSKPRSFCGFTSSNPCSNVLFIESFNGGKTWSDPMSLDRSERDSLRHYKPSMVLEEGTGCVYIVYTVASMHAEDEATSPRLAVREPGGEMFEMRAVSESRYKSLNAVVGITAQCD